MSFFKDNVMGKRRLCGMIASLLLVAAGSACAADENAKEILENVRDRYESTTDGEIRFTQKVVFAMARIEQEVTGTLQFKKENKYRVEYEGQVIVTDGETVWSYSRSTNQVLIDNYKVNERSLTPERILSDAPDDFTPAYVGREKIGKTETIVLKLTPTDPKAMLKSMKLWVQDGEWLIRRVELLDLHGKQTTYQVHSFKTNAGIPDARFTYQIPADVETVDLR